MRLLRQTITIVILVATINIAAGQSHITTKFSDTLTVLFKVGKSNVQPQLGENGKILAKIEELGNKVADTSKTYSYEIGTITIQGTSSPEGAKWFNEYLSKKRAEAIEKYINSEAGVLEGILMGNHKVYQMHEVNALHPGKNYNELYREVFPQLRSSVIVLAYTRTYSGELLVKVKPLPNAKAETETPINLPKYTLQHTTASFPAMEKESSERTSWWPHMAIKTNLLYDALITPNIGLEIKVADRYTVAGNWMYARWHSDPKAWYHRIYGGDLEVRRWLGKKLFRNHEEIIPLEGWHVGVYGQLHKYDFEWGGKGALTDKWQYGGGIAAGWSKAIGKRLALDFTLGFGYLTGEYKEYLPMDGCYVWQATKQRHWIGPTKGEISLVWILGKGGKGR